MRQFSAYVLIGLTCFVLEIGLFKALSPISGIYLSNYIAIFLASLFSFFFNSHFNFMVTDNRLIRFFKFFIVIQLGTLISDIELSYLLRFFTSIQSKILSMPFVVVFQFLVNRLWVFNKSQN